MNRIKISIAVLGAMLVFSSCQQNYNCHCTVIPGASPNLPYKADYDIKANSRAKAATQCDKYDTEALDCGLL